MTFVLRIAILILLPLLALLGHGREILRRFKGEASEPGTADRKGHASVYIWLFCYLAVLVLAEGRMFLGGAPGILAAVGVLLMAAGVGLRLLAVRNLGPYYDEFIHVREDHAVVDTGVFSLCRHPLHKGLILEIGGMALVNGRFLAGALFLLALFFFFQRGIQEEKVLLGALGEDYRTYLRRVPSLLDCLPKKWRSYAPDRDKPEKPDEPETDGE